MSISLAFLQAVWTPKFNDWRSSSIVLSQVVLGRPTGLLQSAGGISAMAMTRWWSSSGAVRARCPKKCSWSDLIQPDTGEQVVMLRTVSLVVCLVYGMHQIFSRHQVSKASGALLMSWWKSMFHIHIAGLVVCRSCIGAPWCLCIWIQMFFSRRVKQYLAIPTCRNNSASLPPL